jgi:hypothetical protein
MREQLGAGARVEPVPSDMLGRNGSARGRAAIYSRSIGPVDHDDR